MPDQADFDAGDFADRLAAMSDDELFETMQRLEEESKDIRPEERDGSNVFAKIALVETAIEDRFRASSLRPTGLATASGHQLNRSAYHDRTIREPERLFQQLDDLVADIIDQFASQGHGTAVVIETLQDVLGKRQLAYQRDPDPAEVAVDEPTNDRPGADDRTGAKD